MRRAKKLSVAAVLLSAMLGGCADMYWDRRDSIPIDPWPPAAAKRRLTTNGDLAQRAAERYRTNRTTPLKPIGTSSVQMGVSAGSPAGGGATPGSP